jgi:hypothetical protein
MGFEDIEEFEGEPTPDWYRYLMILMTGGVIIASLGFAIVRMFYMLFLVVALGGLGAFLMALAWSPKWITYDTPDPDKWRKNREYPDIESQKSVFSGFEKIRL